VQLVNRPCKTLLTKKNIFLASVKISFLFVFKMPANTIQAKISFLFVFKMPANTIQAPQNAQKFRFFSYLKCLLTHSGTPKRSKISILFVFKMPANAFRHPSFSRFFVFLCLPYFCMQSYSRENPSYHTFLVRV